MSTSDILKDTPNWFKRLVIPLVFGIVIAVPITLNWADALADITEIERGLVLIDARLLKLEKHGNNLKEIVQAYEVKQAVMANQMSNMDEKLDRLLRAVED